jgi:hypothetical protein
LGIDSLDERGLKAMIANYEQKSVAEGGKYTLAECLLERMRRQESPIPHVDLARSIIRRSRESADGRVTYLELWNEFRPGGSWKGNASIREVGLSLSRVIEYCIRHRLPLITVLVVQTGSRQLHPRAVQNIYDDARRFGVDVGHDPALFVATETSRSLDLVADDLPLDDLR